jgi:hypothetical protein
VTLEGIRRKRGYVHFLYEDRDASDIAGCAQRLKQCIDNFLVCNLVSWLDDL